MARPEWIKKTKPWDKEVERGVYKVISLEDVTKPSKLEHFKSDSNEFNFLTEERKAARKQQQAQFRSNCSSQLLSRP